VSLPYNFVAIVGVWRSAARYDGPAIHADLARGATVMLMSVLSFTYWREIRSSSPLLRWSRPPAGAEHRRCRIFFDIATTPQRSCSIFITSLENEDEHR
jgi:hypothetical protein